jgi:hypothetical protein
MSDDPKEPPREVDPEMARAVSRRNFLTGELSRSALKTAKQLPGLGTVLGFALREDPKARDRRLVDNLWHLLMGREPKPQEREAGLEVVLNAETPDEKADALVDIAWALCQTKDFEELGRPNTVLVRGFYKIALNRLPREEELEAALAVLRDAPDLGARTAALEGLFTGLMRSAECQLRRPA